MGLRAVFGTRIIAAIVIECKTEGKLELDGLSLPDKKVFYRVKSGETLRGSYGCLIFVPFVVVAFVIVAIFVHNWSLQQPPETVLSCGAVTWRLAMRETGNQLTFDVGGGAHQVFKGRPDVVLLSGCGEKDGVVKLVSLVYGVLKVTEFDKNSIPSGAGLNSL